ncbi:hypothetical protein D9613_000013 [Agrocybe pediades]|uniref:F-box domain-containing protein n=1 Tax=Agrocybe pediades TaxID=84607 RepID=A0A8H4R1K5_9AGAR|nr:hypothetical protein D9613_000013 [Agrocybe pediades]
MPSYSGATIACMDTCPTELVEEILKLVALNKDDDMPSRFLSTINNSQVCKRWNGIISRPALELELWSNLFIVTTPEGRLMPYTWIKRMIFKTQHAKTLRVYGTFRPSVCASLRKNDHFINLMKSIWPRVESLVLTCDRRLYSPGKPNPRQGRLSFLHPRDNGTDSFHAMVHDLFTEPAPKLKSFYFGVLDAPQDAFTPTGRWDPARPHDIPMNPETFNDKMPILEHFESCGVTFPLDHVLFTTVETRPTWCKNLRTLRMRSFNGAYEPIIDLLKQSPLLETLEITDTLVLFNFEPLPPVVNLPKLTFMSINTNKELCKVFVDRIQPSTEGCEIHSSTIPNWEYDIQQLDIQLELEPIMPVSFLDVPQHQG